MRRFVWSALPLTLLLGGAICLAPAQTSGNALIQGFQQPPPPARLRCYWWWLNGHTNAATITRDLEEMKRKGYGGALLVDANGADQHNNGSVPAGPEFGSAAWTALYLHALQEADRLGLEITLNLTSGWNLGGPWVQPENASKLLTWSRKELPADAVGSVRLDLPPAKNGFYRQIAVLAYPLQHGPLLPGERGSDRQALSELTSKSAAVEVQPPSMPDATPLLFDRRSGSPASGVAGQDAGRDTGPAAVMDISDRVDTDGTVRWRPAAGDRRDWELLRIGYTDSDARVSTSSGAWQGLAIDYLDPSALDLYWKTSVVPLLQAGRQANVKSLKYVASDSWELGGTNWTGAFRQEFLKRRGYDPVMYLPVLAGRIVGGRELSTEFLADLRRTVGDLVNAHYDHLAELAREWGLGTQCESGGPHGAPIDALETFRSSAIPQAEFWAMSKEHRTSDTDRFFVKEASSAAHIYGKPLVAAEGLTSIGNQWNESPGKNLRPTFDQALTEGMNRLVWHEFTSSPPELGLPGQEYFAGTHMNPNVTWWNASESFFNYLNRSQFLLQQGQPVADALYAEGDNVPNFVRLKRDNPAGVLPGYDYDVASTDALLGRMKMTQGELRTPEGIAYKLLVLPQSRIMPFSMVQFAKDYMESGGIVVGLPPLRSQGIVSEEEAQRFQSLVAAIWGDCDRAAGYRRSVGQGQLLCTQSGADGLRALGIAPDLEASATEAGRLDFVHRRTDREDIYFIRNVGDEPLQTFVTLRVRGKSPVVFHADTGRIEPTLLFSPTKDGRTKLPVSLEPYGSLFIVLMDPAPELYVTQIERQGQVVYSSEDAGREALPDGISLERDGALTLMHTPVAGSYRIRTENGQVLNAKTADAEAVPVTGPWTLSFPPHWGAPTMVRPDALKSWTEFKEPGIRYFSGTATYETQVQLTRRQLSQDYAYRLDLGQVHEIATVRVNGKPAGTLWKEPYQVDLDGLLHEGANRIQVEVTNLWPNRLIGDAQPTAKVRYTWTNIRAYTKDSPLAASGLLGPVRLVPVYRVRLRTQIRAQTK